MTRQAGAAHHPSLEGVRAFGAAIVFAFHFLGQTNPPWLRGVWSDWRTQLGPQGVAIFFAMSGFLLFRPYAAALIDARRWPGLRPYAARRAVRVVPGYWLALTVCIVVFEVATIHGPGDAAVLFGLVQNYREGWALVGLGVTWTLVVEIAFYVVLPAFAAVLRPLVQRCSTPQAAVAVVIAAIGAVEVAALALRARIAYGPELPARSPGSWGTWRTAQWWLLWHWDWFAGGMVLAVVAVLLARRPNLPRLVERLTRGAGACWIAAGVLYAWMCSWDLGQRGHQSSQRASYWALVLEAVIATLLVVPAVIGPPSGGVLRRVLARPAVVWFATLSYGFYLWHLTFVRQVNRWANDGTVPGGFVSRLVCTLGLSLGAAALSWYLVERPLVALGRRVP